jgi:hypothetical protein
MSLSTPSNAEKAISPFGPMAARALASGMSETKRMVARSLMLSREAISRF